MTEPKWVDNRYQIVSKVGKGGSGTVYSAIDRKDANERLVAVKLLGSLPDRDKDFQKEFFDREVRALSSLSHPRVIRLRKYGHDAKNDVFFLVLDYIEHAKTMRDLRTTWTPDIHSFVDLMVDLLDGISYAHQMSVIHRDVNPGNILFDDKGNAHIIDFGISKILGTLSTGKTVGEFFTRPYASPEQVIQHDVDYSTDQYSLAAVALFLLSGKDPSSSTSLADQFATLPLPQEVQNVFRRMASDVSKDRFPSVPQALLALRSAKQALEASSQHIVVILTRSVIQNLYDQAVIAALSNQQAKDFVNKALTTGVWVSKDELVPGVYDLIADSFSFRCRPDAQHADVEYSRLAMLSAKSGFPPDRIERLRQRSKPVFANWHVLIQGEPMPATAMELAGWLDEIDEYFRNKSVEQKSRERRADLIDSWRDLLSLDLELKQKSLLRIDYLSWSLTNDGAVIKAQLAKELKLDELIATDQLLVMPGARGRSIAVGHYVKQDGNTIYIARLRECNTDQISSAGKITADERQWMSSWRRQKYALDTVLNARCVNPHLPDALIDPAQIERDTQDHISHFFTKDLDEIKQDVISRALATEDIFLIQGPPGTGKTVVISEIVAQLLDRDPNFRILLVSQSNVAVDHVLAKVVDLLPASRIARIGRQDLIGSDAPQHFLDPRMMEWLNGVGTLSKDYVMAHRAESTERAQLEKAFQTIARILEDIGKEGEQAAEPIGEKHIDSINEVKAQFPDRLVTLKGVAF